jgi:hypothetical protein
MNLDVTQPSKHMILTCISAVPKFLHRYTTPLSNAPISHITAFLLLHEITAILPLLTLFATFHYTSLQLPAFFTDSPAVIEGIEKFGRYFKRKGWLGETVEPEARGAEGASDGNEWNVGQDGVKVLVEVGTAWAVVKLLLPVRLVGCVWLTPWFARVAILPVSKVMGRITGGSTGRVVKKAKGPDLSTETRKKS